MAWLVSNHLDRNGFTEGAPVHGPEPDRGIRTTMSIYEIGHSALFAMDLLRRDPDGTAARLVAFGLSAAAGADNDSKRQALPTIDVGDEERSRVRERAMRLGQGIPMADQMNELLSRPETTRDELAALTLGTPRDAWEAVIEFCAPADPCTEIIADAVLWCWARQAIGSQDAMVLIGRAIPYLYETRAELTPDQLMTNLGGWREFEPHDPAMRQLLARVAATSAADFERIERLPDLGEPWNDAMLITTQAAEDHLNEQQVAIAQLLAIGLLGLAGRRVGAELGTLVVAGTNLVGAVQAIMTSDVVDPAIVSFLAREWLPEPP